MEELNIQFPGHLIQSGSVEMTDLFKSAIVNFETGICQFAFAIPNPVEGENAYNVGYVTTDFEALNALLQVTAAQNLEAASGMEPGGLGFKAHGQYDCDAASLMASYASYTRGGKSVGQYYILSIEDVFNLLSQSSILQSRINETLNKSGYEGVTGYNAIPLLKRGLGIFSSKVAGNCNGEPIVVGSDLPPVGGIDVVGAYQEDGSYGWKLWAGVGALAVASVVGYKMVKKGR